MTTSFIINAPSGDRSNFAGTAGYAFTPGRRIIVTALGRGCTTALSGDYAHRMALWRDSDQQQIGATVTINGSSPTDTNGLPFENLPAAVTLLGGVKYVIGSEEFNTTADANKDAWKDVGAVLVSGTDYGHGVAINLPRLLTGSFGFPSTASGSTESKAFVYANYHYHIADTGWHMKPGLGGGMGMA